MHKPHRRQHKINEFSSNIKHNAPELKAFRDSDADCCCCCDWDSKFICCSTDKSQWLLLNVLAKFYVFSASKQASKRAKENEVEVHLRKIRWRCLANPKAIWL